MNSPTETKTSAKTECNYCHRLVAVSYLKTHQKTKLCLTSQENKEVYQPSKPVQVLERYKKENKSKRERLIASVGIDEVRRIEREKKQLLRAKGKQDTTEQKIEEKQLNELKTDNPTLNKSIKKAFDDIKKTGFEIIKIAKTKNTSVIPSLCKEVQDNTSKKLLNSIENINNIKTKEEFLRQFIQKSELKNNNTSRQYVDDLYKFSLKYTNKQPDFTNLDWLKDYAGVFNYIRKSKKPDGKEYKDTSKRTLLTALGAVTSVLGSDFFDISSKYKHLAKNYSKNIQKEQMNNVMSETQKEKAVEWTDLLKMEKLFDSSKGGTSFTRALYSVFTKISPRRPQDYRIMRVVIKKNKKDTVDITKLDTNYNYVICSQTMLPTRLIFNKFKTSTKKEYGQYVLDKIPVKLSNILKEYIVNSNLSTGDFLFHKTNNKNEPYSQGNFSTLISNEIFKLFTDKHIDINSIRHAYVSYLMRQNLSQNQLEIHAKAMGTSVNELQNVYNKIDL